jgi:hypothetical protein
VHWLVCAQAALASATCALLCCCTCSHPALAILGNWGNTEGAEAAVGEKHIKRVVGQKAAQHSAINWSDAL